MDLINYLETKYKINDINTWDVYDSMTVISKKHNMSGIVLSNSLLLLDYKYFNSFRIRFQNFNKLDGFYFFSNRSCTINKSYLENYFLDNQDNPYSLKHVLNNLIFKNISSDFTQYPPLNFKKDLTTQKQNVDTLCNLSETGDMIFTFNRRSLISNKIRTIDQGMWSHTGMVNASKRIIHMATSGITSSDFSSFYGKDIDIALYRSKQKLTQEQKSKTNDYLERSIRMNIQFNWLGIIKVYFSKKFGFPKTHGITPCELIESNLFKLISYA